jgi:hypothetical protein
MEIKGVVTGIPDVPVTITRPPPLDHSDKVITNMRQKMP